MTRHVSALWSVAAVLMPVAWLAAAVLPSDTAARERVLRGPQAGPPAAAAPPAALPAALPPGPPAAQPAMPPAAQPSAPPAAQPATPPAAPAALPTCSAPEHRQFDFWVGAWDVRPNGTAESAPTPLGNVIRLEDAGCVLTEHWTTPRLTGRSVNLYDRTRGQWHQTWVDSTGGLHEYWGNPNADGHMVFRGTTPATAGNTRQAVRLTFFNLGPDKAKPTRVRQFSEVLGADGRWTTNYDLLYVRRSAAP